MPTGAHAKLEHIPTLHSVTELEPGLEVDDPEQQLLPSRDILGLIVSFSVSKCKTLGSSQGRFLNKR